MKGVEVRLENISKRYGNTVALKDVSLSVPRGSLFTVLGPSGCGKSTLLGIVAGFVEPDKGRVFFEGVDVTSLPPQKRNVGMVFQDLALFPHMSVFENIAFGLRVRGEPEQTIREKVKRVMELVRLDFQEYAGRMPHQLSGGQQQRVALARALAIEPRVLLLDEPLSHVDYSVKVLLLEELKRIQREAKVTTLYVTHDQSEAMYLADYLAVMNYGTLEQVGRPEEIYDRPVSEFVARFFGDINIFPGEVAGLEASSKIGVRLERTMLSKKEPHVGNGVVGYMRGRVVEKIFQGPHVLLKLETDYGSVKALLPRSESSIYNVGDRVFVLVPRSGLIVFRYRGSGRY